MFALSSRHRRSRVGRLGAPTIDYGQPHPPTAHRAVLLARSLPNSRGQKWARRNRAGSTAQRQGVSHRLDHGAYPRRSSRRHRSTIRSSGGRHGTTTPSASKKTCAAVRSGGTASLPVPSPSGRPTSARPAWLGNRGRPRLQPFAVPAEVQRPDLLARLADQVALMATFR